MHCLNALLIGSAFNVLLKNHNTYEVFKKWILIIDLSYRELSCKMVNDIVPLSHSVFTIYPSSTILDAV